MDKVKYYMDEANQLMDNNSTEMDLFINSVWQTFLMKECIKTKNQHYFLLKEDDSNDDIDNNEIILNKDSNKEETDTINNNHPCLHK